MKIKLKKQALKLPCDSKLNEENVKKDISLLKANLDEFISSMSVAVVLIK